MKGAWKIESNHIVFQTENELLHPNAEELFAVVNSLPSNFSEEYECEDIHSACDGCLVITYDHLEMPFLASRCSTVVSARLFRYCWMVFIRLELRSV